MLKAAHGTEKFGWGAGPSTLRGIVDPTDPDIHDRGCL